MIGDTPIHRHVGDVVKVAAISILVGIVILLHDASIAWTFGASPDADAYQLALSFPSMALNVFAGGTLLAILVPRLVQFEVSGLPTQAIGLVRRARRSIGFLLITVGLIWALIYPAIVGNDLAPQTLWTSKRLLWVLLVGLLFAGLASIEAAVLAGRRRLALLSALPGFAPACAAASVLTAGSRIGIIAAALGWASGTIVQWITARWCTRTLNRDPSRNVAPSADSRVIKDYVASAAAAALLGGIALSDTLLASSLAPGHAATFAYASRPLMLVMAFATASVSNVALPAFSQLAAVDNLVAVKRTFAVVAGMLLLALLPVVAVFYTFARDIVGIVYERGTLAAEDADRVAAVQAVYALHAPLFVTAVLGWRVMNSFHRHRELCAFTAAAFATNLAVDLWLAPDLGLVGIAWGTNVAVAVWTALILSYVLAMRGIPSKP